MEFVKQKSLKMKSDGLIWLRVDQRCAFIATEVGANNADLLGVNEKKMIEIECKTSLQDLKNDFKKYKHTEYSKYWDGPSQTRWIPTHFYFMVTQDLVEPCRKLLMESAFKFGKVANYGIINADTMTVEKRAIWLHKREPDSRVKFTIALRMGSELCRFHQAWV